MSSENKNEMITFSKLEAAKEQIETAINLFFSNGSVVAIHTLATAALHVLIDISKSKDGVFAKKIESYIKPEYLKKFWGKVNEASNFFKHADRDPDTQLEFNELINDLQILYCCIGYGDLTGKATPLMNNFGLWLMVNEPHLITDGDFKDNLMLNRPHDDFSNLNRDERKKIGKMLIDKIKV